MKLFLMLTIPFVTLTVIQSNSFAQTTPQQYSGDESKCPYLHPEINKTVVKDKTIVVDDFELGMKWNNMNSGSLISRIEICDTAKIGKHGGKIMFSGTVSKESWTMLHCKISSPVEKSKITFWAKVPKEMKVKITAYQGASHDEVEIFGKTIIIGTEWEKYEIAFAEMTELVFSHPQKDGKPASEKLTVSAINAIGFAEVDLPCVFYIDQIQVE